MNTNRVKSLLLLLFAKLMPFLASAQIQVEIDGIWYNLDVGSLQAEVTSIGYYSEYTPIPPTVSCEGMEYFVTSIGDYAFSGCSSLNSITIPGSVTSIGDYAFDGCSSLRYAYIFEYSQLTSIGNNAFHGCERLTEINIPESVTSIGDYAFSGCSSLNSITIPVGVTSIGEGAFDGCSSLTAITIPEGVTSIGGIAFYNCEGLTSITIPEGVTRIVSGAFAGCNSLTAITVAEGNTKYDSRGGCNAIIETNSNTLIAGCSTTIIPEGVTSIGDYAFWGCHNLTAITIPEGMTSIGDWVLTHCSSLTAITCEAAIPPTIGSYTFSDEHKSIPVYVPAGSIETYKSAEYWGEFTNFQPLAKANEFTLTVSSAGYATLFLDYAAEVPEGVKAYIATSVEGDRLKMTQVTGVLPAETGVIVRAAEGTYTFTESDDATADIEGNLLSGTASNEYILAESGYKYYVLSQVDGVVGMYLAKLKDNGTFLNNANKAYLVLKMDDLGIFDEETNTEDEGGQLSNRLRFDFGGTTGIEQSTDNSQQTTVIYDLQGRKVTDTEGLKGIYIIDGRKVVIK